MFDSCTLHWCEQRTDEWFRHRRGLLTASEFGEWLFKSGKVADAARLKAASKLLAEIAGCELAPVFENWAMKRGAALEPEAVENFTTCTGLEVTPCGFARHNDGAFGCSPDGLIMATGEGLENKCPVPDTHVRYLLEGVLPDTYKAQVHGSMAVTGARAWWFQSYCPGLPPLILRVERDDYTEQLLKGLLGFSVYLKQAQRDVAKMWETWAAKRKEAA